MKRILLFWFIGLCTVDVSAAEENFLQDATLLAELQGGHRLYLQESENEQAQAVIGNGLYAFNIERSGRSKYEDCVITIKDLLGVTVAGAVFTIQRNGTGGDVGVVQAFWIDENHKNSQLVTAIIDELTHYTLYKNCSTIQFATYECCDQDYLFFEKMGFDYTATLPNPENSTGFRQFFMRKTIYLEDDAMVQKYESKFKVDGYQLCMIDDDGDANIENNENYRFIMQQFENYRILKLGIIGEQPYVIFIVSPQGTVIGGTKGHLYTIDNFGICNVVHWLWIDEAYQGCKFGTEIMKQVEFYAIRKACKFILLDTCEWQAKPFYEKLGYSCIATIPNFKNCTGYEQYFMRKNVN